MGAAYRARDRGPAGCGGCTDTRTCASTATAPAPAPPSPPEPLPRSPPAPIAVPAPAPTPARLRLRSRRQRQCPAATATPAPVVTPVLADFDIGGWKLGDGSRTGPLAEALTEMKDQNGCRVLTRIDARTDMKFIALKSADMTCGADGYGSGPGSVDAGALRWRADHAYRPGSGFGRHSLHSGGEGDLPGRRGQAGHAVVSSGQRCRYAHALFNCARGRPAKAVLVCGRLIRRSMR